MKVLHCTLFCFILSILRINFAYAANQEDGSGKSIVQPLGLPDIPWPADNPYSSKKADLGKLLFFDKRLSSDCSVSCATCHIVSKAFGDDKPIARGELGRLGTRHAPTVINTGYLRLLFWDGRAKSLEEQVMGPTGNDHEMTLAKDAHRAHQECHKRVMKIVGYRALFKDVFGSDECSMDQIAQAIATFERTILSGDSAYDRYKTGDESAMSAEQREGFRVFQKARCANCHFGPNFTDERFINIGVGMDEKNPDLGRYLITKEVKDWGAFKIPTLREVASTGPYMHNGSLKTLEDVIDYYNKGGNPNQNLHPLMRPLNLSDMDKKALISFLHALSGKGWEHCTAPDRLPN